MRQSARAILLNQYHQMLWLHVQDDIGWGGLTRFWCVPGGGLEPGETFDQALSREVYEELGLKLETTFPHIATVKKLVIIRGQQSLEESRFFLVRLENPELSFENPDAAELETFLGHRWWGLAEMKESEEIFLPEEILEVVESLIRQS